MRARRRKFHRRSFHPEARTRVHCASLRLPVVAAQAGLIQRQYHIVGVPTSYLIGVDGQVLWQQVGGILRNRPADRIEVEKATRR